MTLHSYLTYMRDRLLLCRELLAPTGSIFVQISDENVHHVRELMDEVFGVGNFVSLITFRKTGGEGSIHLGTTCDFLLWYGKDKERLRFRRLFSEKRPGDDGAAEYTQVETSDGTTRALTADELQDPSRLPEGARVFATWPIVSPGYSAENSRTITVEHDGRSLVLRCPANRHWSVGVEGTTSLWRKGRLLPREGQRIFKRYISDFGFTPLGNQWQDTRGEVRAAYVVQTAVAVIQRCVLMTSDPGDLVLDPTCGSGTTAYVAEQWGRRWITIDVSRVPLALARQRLLTATFPWHQLKDESRGPGGGFVYERKQNRKGEEVGGLVPHVTLKSIANDQPPETEVLVDRPESDSHFVRVTGAFTVEGTIPTPLEGEERPSAPHPGPLPEGEGGDRQCVSEGAEPRQPSPSGGGLGEGQSAVPVAEDNVERMVRILRASPVLRLAGNTSVTLQNVRRLAQSLSIHATASVPGDDDASVGQVAVVFGSDNGAVSERSVYDSAVEARAKGFAHLYVIGFAIQPNARVFVENCEQVAGIAATYIQATPDLLMGDLLKNMRSSQVFSVCGLPDIVLRKTPTKEGDRYEVDLLGLDVFDPASQESKGLEADDVPCWMLDTDYNGLCFHVCQAFFPRTSAWDSLKKALKAEFEESVWDHLSGTTSAPFEEGGHKQIAVKVIDDRGNELMVVKRLADALTPTLSQGERGQG